MAGRLEYRPVTGDVALGRQGVHGLGAGDAGDALHGEDRDVPGAHGADHLIRSTGLGEADIDAPILQSGDLLHGRLAYLDQDLRTQGGGIVDDRRSRRAVIRVGKMSGKARTCLDPDLESLA